MYPSQISTIGPLPNTAFISSLGPDVLSKRGYIAVKPTLQLSAHPSIYAAGDAIDWPEQKQAAKAGGHAKVVATNILSAIKGTPTTALYKGAPEMILITDGKVRLIRLPRSSITPLTLHIDSGWRRGVFRRLVGNLAGGVVRANGQVEGPAPGYCEKKCWTGLIEFPWAFGWTIARVHFIYPIFSGS